MSIETWGLMPKSQTDNETIEQAIARLIAEHETDPTAHLGPNESIEAHRNSEVIDHLAGSIVPDKQSNTKKVFDYNLGIINASNIDNCTVTAGPFNTVIKQTTGQNGLGSYYVDTLLPYDYGYADGEILIDFIYGNQNQNYTWLHRLYFGFCVLEFKYTQMRIGYYNGSWQYTSWVTWNEQWFQHFRIHYDVVNGVLNVFFRDTVLLSVAYTILFENDEFSMQLWINRGSETTNYMYMANLKVYIDGI